MTMEDCERLATLSHEELAILRQFYPRVPVIEIWAEAVHTFVPEFRGQHHQSFGADEHRRVSTDARSPDRTRGLWRWGEV
jgi:hypothetical protein